MEETTLARLDVLEQQDTQGRRAQGTATESGEPMRDMDKHHESIGLKENNLQMVDVFQCHVCFIKRADESDLNILKSKPFRTHASREWELEGKRCWSVDFVSENQWVPRSFNELLGWISQPESLIQGRVRHITNNTSCFLLTSLN